MRRRKIGSIPLSCFFGIKDFTAWYYSIMCSLYLMTMWKYLTRNTSKTPTMHDISEFYGDFDFSKVCIFMNNSSYMIYGRSIITTISNWLKASTKWLFYAKDRLEIILKHLYEWNWWQNQIFKIVMQPFVLVCHQVFLLHIQTTRARFVHVISHVLT